MAALESRNKMPSSLKVSISKNCVPFKPILTIESPTVAGDFSGSFSLHDQNQTFDSTQMSRGLHKLAVTSKILTSGRERNPSIIHINQTPLSKVSKADGNYEAANMKVKFLEQDLGET